MNRSTKNVLAVVLLSLVGIALIVHFILVPNSFVGFLLALVALGVMWLICWAVQQLLGWNDPKPDPDDDDDYDFYTNQW
jgi:hypothetical protein